MTIYRLIAACHAGGRPGRHLAPLLLALAGSSTEAAPQVPLCPGLTIVTAVSQPNGDYESIKRIESVDSEGIRLKYSFEAPNTGWFANPDEPVIRTVAYRRVLAKDLWSASDYQQVFTADADELIPETTAIGTSAAVLDTLKSVGEATIRISLLPAATPLRAGEETQPNAYDFFQGGTIKRLGIVSIPVIVNDRPVELTAVHARGQVAFEDSEFFFLDDEQNPMTLRMRLGIGAIPPMDPMLADTCAQMRKDGVPDLLNACLPEGGDRDTLQVVKISYECEGPELAGGGDPGGAGPAPLSSTCRTAAPEELPGEVAMAAKVEAQAEGPGEPAMTAAPRAIRRAATEGPARWSRHWRRPAALMSTASFFSFNSDEILDESEPTLAEIANLMRKHPQWRLSLNGHTDSIASASYNLELSRRRANATMRALVERYGVPADRLTAAGSGESSPIDTNDTLEGRARNRRVELIHLP